MSKLIELQGAQRAGVGVGGFDGLADMVWLVVLCCVGEKGGEMLVGCGGPIDKCLLQLRRSIHVGRRKEMYVRGVVIATVAFLRIFVAGGCFQKWMAGHHRWRVQYCLNLAHGTYGGPYQKSFLTTF